jgi:hypothetical protein
MLANKTCEGDCAFLIEPTPMIESTAPAPKLAPAEKHISNFFRIKKTPSLGVKRTPAIQIG